ncbi:2EXR family [Microdochium nivale]|nr:2EXR family [Microdochium nivale]
MDATFHPFPRLPSELRRAIYLLATPQRVVHVQERFEPHANYREARRRFGEATRNRTTPWRQGLRDNAALLHPSVAAVTRMWLWDRPGDAGGGLAMLDELQQNLMRRWGIVDAEDDDVEQRLWEACRRTQLYSRAPIPALLHVCAESRQVLVESGYELAFGTRATCSAAYTAALRRRLETGSGACADDDDGVLYRHEEHGGMTWFNFSRGGGDVLYVGHDEYEKVNDTLDRQHNVALCSAQPWDVSALLPQDLARVRRLMLAHGSGLVGLTGYGSTIHGLFVGFLRLFPGVEELLLGEWALLGQKNKEDQWGRFRTGPATDEWRRDRQQRSREAWFCIAQRDIDAFSPAVLKLRNGQQGTALGVATMRMADVLRGQSGGGGDGDAPEYLDIQTQLWQAEVANEARRAPIRFYGNVPLEPWAGRVPACRLMHVGTEDMLETLQAERAAVWEELCRTRDEVPPERDGEGSLWRPLMPAPWDRESGWMLDKVRCPVREQVVWSVAEEQRWYGE